jgi:hypothetical protein
MPSEDQTIPQWASDLRVSVAKIEGKTEQIPEIGRALEELRANTVPMNEHLKLMADVEELKSRDLGERSDWEEMKMRLPVLWDERAQLRGSLATVKVMVAILGLVVAVLTAWNLLVQTGLSISHK